MSKRASNPKDAQERASKPIDGNQYRPTKIPLNSVRAFEYTEVVLKNDRGIDPNDQNSILEHLDKMVTNLIHKASQKTTNSELRLPLVRVKLILRVSGQRN